MEKFLQYIAVVCMLCLGLPAYAQDAPMRLWVGTRVNEAATEFSSYSKHPRVEMEEAIEITSLKNGLAITKVTVNRGNLNYTNRVRGLPVTLNFGEKYSVTRDFDASVEETARRAEASGMRREEANQAIIMAMMAAANKEAQVLEVAVELSDGATWTFSVNAR